MTTERRPSEPRVQQAPRARGLWSRLWSRYGDADRHKQILRSNGLLIAGANAVFCLYLAAGAVAGEHGVVESAVAFAACAALAATGLYARRLGRRP